MDCSPELSQKYLTLKLRYFVAMKASQELKTCAYSYVFLIIHTQYVKILYLSHVPSLGLEGKGELKRRPATSCMRMRIVFAYFVRSTQYIFMRIYKK